MTGPDEPATSQEGPWLSRNVTVLSGVSFLQDAASELLYPILPIFLTTVLGAPAAVVGAIEGIADGTAALSKAVAGRAADRWRRPPLIAAGYGLAAVGKLLIALATVWPVVAVARVVDRIGKGVRGAPRDALLVTGIAPGQRGRVFGFHRTADTAGAVIGPLLGVALYELLGHQFRPLFWIAVIPAVASVLLVRAVTDPRPRPARHDRRVRTSARPELPARFWRVLGVLTVFSLANFPDALLLLRLHDLGMPTAGVVLAYAGYNLAYAALSYPAGRLADRLPARLVYALGLGFFAVGYLGLALGHSLPVAIAVLVLYGGFNACTDGVGKAWISKIVPTGVQGSAQGIYQGATGTAVLLAGIWAGLAWGTDGTLPLLISGATGAAFALLMLSAPVLGRTRASRASI
ncbi:MFS transporter [Amycolatopsis mongoliensis]|uniref:MFS transporter n=1 Tax=Amycolatopsis mongoliensis TaxID=715475 RepID=A0A9Y2JHK4_9PSEU|nr:MFS transporter [Amycolatopsis sp. 4-36]WIX98654.1 MFS transporter [Amycolatopsis sp. 4-36]